MKIILFGAPGAGKGTQADVLSERMSIPTISTGNIIREALAKKTPMGLAAKSYMDEGKLVPDDVVIGIIKDRLAEPDCEKGFILDGFPRTIPQAEALEKMGIDVDCVAEIFVPDEVICERMTGRRVCPKCKATYHIVNNAPHTEGICDVCGEKLEVRADDAPEIVKERLRVYHEQTEPLKGFYTERRILRTIDGTQGVSETTKLLFEALEA